MYACGYDCVCMICSTFYILVCTDKFLKRMYFIIVIIE